MDFEKLDKSVYDDHQKWLAGGGGNRADLSGADLSGAYLRGAYLSGADLSGADLSGANLSGAVGLLLQSEFMARFSTDESGWIVYRVEQGQYEHPIWWKFEPGAFLAEVPNPDRCTKCGCGVSFATLDWVRGSYPGKPVWRCRIRWEDGPGIVVPYNTDGKARCERLELIEIVQELV